MPFADLPARGATSALHCYFERHGSGDPVVFISGTGGDLRQDPQRANGPLQRSFDVLMYDQRGLGQTSKPDAAYTMADYADDCVALMNHVGWARAHVVGVSFGGMVAQHVAIRHPDRVNRLVLACTSSGGAGGSSADLLAFHALPADERMKAMFEIIDSRNDFSTDPPTIAPGLEVFIKAYAGQARPLNADDPSAEMGARRQLEARRDHDTWDDLMNVTARTYVVGGRYDALAPAENMERLAQRIPGATLQLFDGGHVFFMQDPDAMASVVRFLQTP